MLKQPDISELLGDVSAAPEPKLKPEPAKALKPGSKSHCAFSQGDVVVVHCLTSPEEVWLAGEVVGYNSSTGMVEINVGIPGQPYCCSPDRLSRYDGIVDCYRLGSRAYCDRLDCPGGQAHGSFACHLCGKRSTSWWWRVGHTAIKRPTDPPKWPDSVWFPWGYCPNLKKFP